MEDSIPRSIEGQVLSIADKLDTLREYFKIGLAPTGSKDPYALRRAGQGIIKILFEAPLPIPIFNFIEQTRAARIFCASASRIICVKSAAIPTMK